MQEIYKNNNKVNANFKNKNTERTCPAYQTRRNYKLITSWVECSTARVPKIKICCVKIMKLFIYYKRIRRSFCYSLQRTVKNHFGPSTKPVQ